CFLWMIGGTVYSIVYELTHRFRTPVANFHEIASLFALFAPIFIAMRTALGETTDHTKSFADGLPISAHKRGWLRLLSGAAVLVLPIVLGAVLLSGFLAFGWMEQAPLRPLNFGLVGMVKVPQRHSIDALASIAMLWKVTAIVACSTCSLYAWLALLGTALHAESHAGFAGAAFAACWFIAGAERPVLEEVATLVSVVAPQSMVINCSYQEANGSYGDLWLSQFVFWPLVVNCLVQLGVSAWFVSRYSRSLPRCAAGDLGQKAMHSWRRWALPLPTRTLALTWLTLRQSLPMCVPGLVLAFLISLYRSPTGGPYWGLVLRAADELPGSMWVVGLLWATVVGAGIFASEFDHRISEFWRTWPTSSWRFFAVKFLIGMATTLAVLDGSTIAATWTSPWGYSERMSWPYIACIVPLHATMYSIAVAWACVLRRAVLGGMAAIVTFAIVLAALAWSSATRDLSPIEVYNRLNNYGMGPLETHGPLDFSAHGFPIVATAMGLIIVACVLIGRRALGRYRPRFAS
ncbi:MAG: hypothetical protein ABIU95_00145, partial [Burkholderiales bacterium]